MQGEKHLLHQREYVNKKDAWQHRQLVCSLHEASDRQFSHNKLRKFGEMANPIRHPPKISPSEGTIARLLIQNNA